MSQYSNRGSMVRRGGKSDYGNLPPLQNVVGMIDRLVVAQPGKSNPDKDYAEIYLVHSVPELGLVAEFDENGAPLTKIKVMMPPPREGGEGRRDILGLTQKKAGGSAMGQGSLVVFEKAYFDRKENVLKARFSKGGPTAADQEEGLKNLYSNIFVCVLPERQVKQQDGTTFPRQETMIADQLGSVVVTGDEDLRAAIESTIAQTTIGTAGFQLHCRQLADEALSDEEKAAFAADLDTRQSGFVTAKPKLVGEGESRQWVPLTTDEILERLWKDFPNLADRWGKPGFQFEFVPMMVVNQAPTLVPSSRKNDKGRDNSRFYAIFDYDPDRGNELRAMDQGWAMSHVTVERMAADSNIWYSTYQSTVSARPQMFALPDIPTPHMPDYHLTAVQAEAARLGENKRAYFQARRAQEQAPAEEQDGPAPR